MHVYLKKFMKTLFKKKTNTLVLQMWEIQNKIN